MLYLVGLTLSYYVNGTKTRGLLFGCAVNTSYIVIANGILLSFHYRFCVKGIFVWLKLVKETNGGFVMQGHPRTVFSQIL